MALTLLCLARYTTTKSPTATAEECHDAEGERNVGCHRYTPAPGGVTGGVEGKVDQRGDDHSPNGGNRWTGRRLSIAEVAETSLPLDLEPDDEEEERHQRIVDHVAERLVEINRTELEEQVDIPELLVTLAEREIRPEQRDCGRPEQCEPG